MDEPKGLGFGPAPVTGLLLHPQRGRALVPGDGGIPAESGLAETYLMNMYTTCCSSGSPTHVDSAAGHLKSSLGDLASGKRDVG